MTKRLIILMASLVLVVPFVFYGCSGDDGSAGPAGATGATGGTGATGPPGPGVVSNEACVVCHGQNNDFQIANVHEFDPLSGVQNTLGTATITINSVTFGAPAGDNVPVTFTFTFQAISADKTNITSGVDLTRKTGTGANDNLAFVSFLLAKLTPNDNTGSNEWGGFVVEPTLSGSSPFRTNRPDNVTTGVVFTRTTNTPAVGTDTYSYTFHTSAVRVLDGYVDNVVMRAGIQFSIGGPVNSSSGVITTENEVNSSVLDLFSKNLKLQNTSDRRPAANGILDVVSGVGTKSAAPSADYPTRNDVTTAACNNCHDILAIHGGGRRDTRLCVMCHNAKLETAANGASTYARSSLLNLIHRIHTSQENLIFGTDVVTGQSRDFDFDEVRFPQSPQNCLTCHKGTDDNFKTRPTRYACGSCHINVNFATGAGHSIFNFAQPSDANCTTCHEATGNTSFGGSVSAAHANKEGAPPTPNNPYVLPGLAVFQYVIDNVTVGADNAATITFSVKKWVGNDNGDGGLGTLSFVNFLQGSPDGKAVAPAGFTGSPAFLIAHSGSALNPQDYTNWDEVATTGFGQSYATGQPKSVNLIGLPVTSTDNQVFKTVLTGLNTFPGNAKMRAVALQGYFTQTTVDITSPPDGVLDNVPRHTPAVMKSVTGDATRRVVVKSGYFDNVTGKLDDNPKNIAKLTPIGCLECHEAFEGHGGSRVNNVQVCVMCHNPQLTTSGRTIPDNVTIDTTVKDNLGANPLLYPEVTQQMPSLVHGLHAGFGPDPAATSTTAAGLRQQNVRVNNFQIVRNRQASPGVYGVYLDSKEVTYPGDLTHCTKCHFPTQAPSTGNVSQSYKADLPPGILFATEAVTTGITNETLAQIIGARQSFQGHDPSGNATDNVDSPLASRCGYCHDTPAAVGHFLSTGGADIKATRSTAEKTPPLLMPDVLATP